MAGLSFSHGTDHCAAKKDAGGSNGFDEFINALVAMITTAASEGQAHVPHTA
jgi:hypothetical protein